MVGLGGGDGCFSGERVTEGCSGLGLVMVNGDTKACSELTAASDDAIMLFVAMEDDGDTTEPSTECCEVKILDRCGSVS